MLSENERWTLLKQHNLLDYSGIGLPQYFHPDRKQYSKQEFEEGKLYAEINLQGDLTRVNPEVSKHWQRLAKCTSEDFEKICTMVRKAAMLKDLQQKKELLAALPNQIEQLEKEITNYKYTLTGSK